MEKGLKKTLIISGVIGGAAVIGYLFYKEIVKAMDFTIKPKGVKSLGVSNRTLKLLVNIGVQNKSNLQFILKNQEYDIYINGIFITRLKNEASQIIYPTATSFLQFNLDLNIDDLAAKLNVISGATISDKLNVLANLKNQNMKLVSKLSVKYGILPSIPIEIPYENTFKGWGL
jgi:LEA14-like dessication related protein